MSSPSLPTPPAPPAPLRDEELRALPVFPLPRVVFFPGTRLPLHLFEPRYREMMEHCLGEGPDAIAIATLAPGWEEDYEGRPAFHEIACVGRIIEHHKRPDGRYDLVLHGLTRVRLQELPAEGFPFRRARAERLGDHISHPEMVASARTTLLASVSQIVRLIRERHPQFSLGLEGELDSGALADRIADQLLTDSEERRHILEALDVKVRLNLLSDAMNALLARVGLRSLDHGGGALH